MNHYSTRWTRISYIPYTACEELRNSLTLKYYICFVVGGTMSMSTAIEKTRLSLNRFISRHQAKSYRSEYRFVYRDHCDLRELRKTDWQAREDIDDFFYRMKTITRFPMDYKMAITLQTNTLLHAENYKIFTKVNASTTYFCICIYVTVNLFNWSFHVTPKDFRHLMK